jgi:hypothetical protein
MSRGPLCSWIARINHLSAKCLLRWIVFGSIRRGEIFGLERGGTLRPPARRLEGTFLRVRPRPDPPPPGDGAALTLRASVEQPRCHRRSPRQGLTRCGAATVQMPQDPLDHLRVLDRGNDPQRPCPARSATAAHDAGRIRRESASGSPAGSAAVRPAARVVQQSLARQARNPNMPLHRLVCALERAIDHFGRREAMSAISGQKIGY